MTQDDCLNKMVKGMLKSPSMFTWMLKFTRSLLILLACLVMGKGLSWIIDGLLPASIIGMLLLTLALAVGLIKLEWVELGANLLLRWLSLLFVAISVGLVEQLDILFQYGWSILLILVVSTLLVMCFAGRLWQWLERC